MSKELGLMFRQRLDLADFRLSRVGEQQAAEHFRPCGWLRKELLGHHLDSAANYHQRFVRATLDGHNEGPGYEQQGWVALHNYRELPWVALLSGWRDRNAMLARLVERIDEPHLQASCKIGDGAPVTLQFLIEDYLQHLDHHVDQITEESVE